MNITPEQWRSLSALLDVAMELNESELAAWLAQLPEDQLPLVPHLRALLVRRAGIQTGDFLDAPPDFAAALHSEKLRLHAEPSEFQPGACSARIA